MTDTSDFSLLTRIPVLIYPSHEEVLTGRRLQVSPVQTAEGNWRKTASPRGAELLATPSTLELPL